MRMRTWLTVAAFFLLAGGLQPTALVMARGFGGRGFGGGFGGYGGYGRGFAGPGYGLGWGWGWGWGDPWLWYPYYYPGSNVFEYKRVNYGTVQFKVKPENTKVYVDQKFIGTVNELDHHRAYLPSGNHDIKLAAPDGQTLDRSVYIAVGQKIKIDEKLP